MATEDRLSRKEIGGDIGAGLGGALLGAFMSPMFARQTGMSFTQQVGQGLVRNKDVLTAPFFSQLSRDDERIYGGVELDLTGEHGGVPYKDILTQLYKRMGPWASDRFRSIVIGIPIKSKKETKKITKRDNSTEEVTSEDTATENRRATFLKEVIGDIIRFSGTDANETPPRFEKGIEEVLKNLKVRNIADADSMTAKISRWWNEPLDEKSDRELALAVDALKAKLPKPEPVSVGPLGYLIACLMGERKNVRLF